VKRAAVLAVDGGGSKTDVALLGRDGRVLSAVRAAGASFHPAEHEPSVVTLRRAVRRAARRIGIDPDAGPVAEMGALCLAGADLPVDDRRILAAVRREALAEDLLLRNDTFAVLRAGTEADWGVGVVCGTGLNCTGVGPTGKVVRFPALGAISGDGMGGGGDLWVQAIGAAVRARDGRGPRTALEAAVCAHFGVRRPIEAMTAVHLGTVSERRLLSLAPVVLRTADAGDPVAGDIVDRMSEEVVTLVGAAVRRLRLVRHALDVVLGGGIARSGSVRFHSHVRAGIAEAAPEARVIVLHAPPVLGAALMGLDKIGARRAAATRVRAELTADRFT
jgi:N-acetylglucosamine kinase-like BadF-type ATPase